MPVEFPVERVYLTSRWARKAKKRAKLYGVRNGINLSWLHGLKKRYYILFFVHRTTTQLSTKAPLTRIFFLQYNPQEGCNHSATHCPVKTSTGFYGLDKAFQGRRKDFEYSFIYTFLFVFQYCLVLFFVDSIINTVSTTFLNVHLVSVSLLRSSGILIDSLIECIFLMQMNRMH